jgi:hypothetical protein
MALRTVKLYGNHGALVKSLYRFRSSGQKGPYPAEVYGRSAIFDVLAYAGPSEAAETVLASLRRLVPPIADLLRPMPYPRSTSPEGEGYKPEEAYPGPIRAA